MFFSVLFLENDRFSYLYFVRFTQPLPAVLMVRFSLPLLVFVLRLHAAETWTTTGATSCASSACLEQLEELIPATEYALFDESTLFGQLHAHRCP
jgi:hypothetical protein